MKNTQNNTKNDFYWRCTVCGYEYESENLPKDYVCPVCGAFAPKFERRSHREDNEGKDGKTE